ncbi:hypothetical protein [Streptomyces cellulosae]|uniref:hypothetical protein n=1 Tax=Streptomyces cellulosae TaxID=1968 RepID=UPI0004C86EF4|nr:hypothetical protein [Streptomyces cellulosae]
MVRFMDWSVVTMGCVLVLASLGSRWWERVKAPKGQGLDQGMRFFWAWLPLLTGLGMIAAKVPGLLRAPYTVVEIVDALNFVTAVVVLVIAVRLGRRVFRTRTIT